MGGRHRLGLRRLRGTHSALVLAHPAWLLLLTCSLAAAQSSTSATSASSTCYLELVPGTKADAISLSLANQGAVILGSTADVVAREPDDHTPAPLARSVILGSCRIPSREMNQVRSDEDRVRPNSLTETVPAGEMQSGLNKMASPADNARTPLVVLDRHEAGIPSASWPSVVLQIVGLVAVLFVFSLLLCLGFILLTRRLVGGSDALFRVQFINQRAGEEAGHAPEVRMAKILTRPKRARKPRSASLPSDQTQNLANRPADYQEEKNKPKAEKKMLRQILKQNLQLREQIGELSAAS